LAAEEIRLRAEIGDLLWLHLSEAAVYGVLSLVFWSLIFVVTAVFLFSDRDTAPIFGHLSPLAGAPHR